MPTIPTPQLSVASAIAKRGLGRSVLLAERHTKLGWEASSHNSEVLHASVYYPPTSLKAQLCRKGNQMMYSICERAGIPHANLGKLLVPRSREEVKLLPRMLATALASGGKGVRLVDKAEIRDLEPNVEAEAAIYCPTTGIVDSHALMQYYEAEAHGVDIARNAEVVAIEKFKGTSWEEVWIDRIDRIHAYTHATPPTQTRHSSVQGADRGRGPERGLAQVEGLLYRAGSHRGELRRAGQRAHCCLGRDRH
jgi:L-2-hydroxyglutarate oxidase LhgO